MKIPFFQVDTFTSNIFTGNPAAICILEDWLNEDQMLSIASENNLSETAFCVKSSNNYELRWFSPVEEIDLCGHATLATAFVIKNYLDKSCDCINFETQSGILEVKTEGKYLSLNFPSREAKPCTVNNNLIEALGAKPKEVLASRDYLAIFDSEEEIASLKPNMEQLKKIDHFGVIVSAPGKQADFVSRFFAPKAGIPEDPVTGSSHCTLIPYWAKRFSKSKLRALQISQRGGELICKHMEDRVEIAGEAALYLKGEIFC